MMVKIVHTAGKPIKLQNHSQYLSPTHHQNKMYRGYYAPCIQIQHID
jgi:hypothetical protein